ncbi:MAG: hypothetical protein ABI091_13885 [Ferruginibacter sp.]
MNIYIGPDKRISGLLPDFDECIASFVHKSILSDYASIPDSHREVFYLLHLHKIPPTPLDNLFLHYHSVTGSNKKLPSRIKKQVNNIWPQYKNSTKHNSITSFLV